MARVRLAGQGDAGMLTNLRCAFLEELGQTLPDGFADHLRAWIEAAFDDGRLLGWIAENEGKVVGCAAVNPYAHLPSLGYPGGVGWYLLNVYVKPAHRRGGVAGRLLAAVGAEARERGVDVLSLHSTEPAWKMYEKYGFRPSMDAMSMSLVAG